MFAARPELSGLDPVDVLLGPTAGAPYDVVPIATANKYRNEAVGERKSTNKTFTRMGKNERLSYDTAAFCQSYFDRLTETLQSFTGAGSRVAMLLIPSHEVPYGLAPELHDRALAELQRISDLTGVPLIPVAGDLPSELTDDGLHPNRTGRLLYSEWLGKALPGLFDTP
jgi:lysophospholipase L1-like esterase